MLKFSRLLSCSLIALGLCIHPLNQAFAEDDLAMDMGLGLDDLDTEETELSTPPSNTKNELSLPHKTTTPPPASNQILAPKIQKTVTKKSDIDTLTKIRLGREITADEIEEWVTETQDINVCLDNGKTVLLYLIANSTNLDAIRILLEYGADLQTHCEPRYEALFIAAINNALPEVTELLINNGANIVERDHEGNTALMLAAAFNKSSPVTDILIEYGLKINVKNKYGHNALMLSSYENGNIRVLQSLIDNEADINATDEEGHTALMAAAIAGRENVMQYLIKRGADYKIKDKKGLTVLDYFNKRKYLKTLGYKENQFATLSEHINEEFNFIADNHNKYNQELTEGIFKENADELVSDAIENLADIDIASTNGCSTLLNATLYNKPQSILEKLIAGKANVNAECLDGKNALIFISAQADSNHNPTQQIAKAKLLLDSGLEINHTDKENNSALMYAIANNADTEYLTMLLNNNADTNITNKQGETALWTAIRKNTPLNNIKLLIENGADINQKDSRGETPLWYLLRTKGNDEMIQLFLRSGADTAIANATGELPLWYAFNNNFSEPVIEGIIRAQTDLNIKNEQGDTPLLYAIKKSYPASLITLMINQGADPNVKDKNGNNAYDILAQSKFFDAAIQKQRREQVLNSWD